MSIYVDKNVRATCKNCKELIPKDEKVLKYWTSGWMTCSCCKRCAKKLLKEVGEE